MQLISNPIDTRPILLSDVLATITPAVGTVNATINVTKDATFLLNNDYPDGLFNNLKTGWQRSAKLYLFVPKITFTGTTYGTVTVSQVLNGGNVPIAQRTFYSQTNGWVSIPLSLHQYPDDATTVSLYVSVLLPTGATVTGACKLYYES